MLNAQVVKKSHYASPTNRAEIRTNRAKRQKICYMMCSDY